MTRDARRCGRPTKGTGGICTRRPAIGAPACHWHCTEEEREQAERAAQVPTWVDEWLSDPVEPACWRWPVIALRELQEKICAEHAGLSAGAARRLLADDEGMLVLALRRWHRGRCAVCAGPAEVTDHDHETGLVRGLLCHSCNVREGAGRGGAFDGYRARPPAAMLGIRVRYVGPWVTES